MNRAILISTADLRYGAVTPIITNRNKTYHFFFVVTQTLHQGNVKQLIARMEMSNRFVKSRYNKWAVYTRKVRGEKK
jgi:hypothetical protein